MSGVPYLPVHHKAPHPRVTVPPLGTLPEGRFRRCAASDGAVDFMRAWWAGLTPEDRAEQVAAINLLPDLVLSQLLGAVEALRAASVRGVIAWVAAQPDPNAAAVLAAQVERMQPAPRPSLQSKLGDA